MVPQDTNIRPDHDPAFSHSNSTFKIPTYCYGSMRFFYDPSLV